MSLFYAFVALCLAERILAQIPQPGPCPKIEAMPNFETSKFMGKWYWYQTLLIPDRYQLEKCTTFDYSPDDNDTINELQSFILRSEGWKISKLAMGHVPDPEEPAKYEIKLNTQIYYEYILGTDYTAYAVMYVCQNVNADHYYQSFVLTRDQHPPAWIDEKAGEIIEKHHLDKSSFRLVKQTECELKPDQ